MAAEAGVVPRCLIAGLLVLGESLASGIGELEASLVVNLGGGDEPSVFEASQGRVDRAGARLPAATAALFECGDQLIAVHRLFDQECQDRSPDGTPSGAMAAVAVGPPAMVLMFVFVFHSVCHVFLLQGPSRDGLSITITIYR